MKGYAHDNIDVILATGFTKIEFEKLTSTLSGLMRRGGDNSMSERVEYLETFAKKSADNLRFVCCLLDDAKHDLHGIKNIIGGIS